MLTRTIAVELAKYKITVNNIGPGTIGSGSSLVLAVSSEGGLGQKASTEQLDSGAPVHLALDGL
jgi:NAD(P)-dependent dehydrogenase (short-subunit alcohol dehydrogenase family)